MLEFSGKSVPLTLSFFEKKESFMKQRQISDANLKRIQDLFTHFPKGVPLRRNWKKVSADWLERGGKEKGEKVFSLDIAKSTFHAGFTQDLKMYGHVVDEY